MLPQLFCVFLRPIMDVSLNATLLHVKLHSFRGLPIQNVYLAEELCSHVAVLRNEIRHRYKIHGNGCEDCCMAFWCQPCSILQHDNEVRQRHAMGKPPVVPYQTEPVMKMPPPAHY
ncbi:hypothetical protein F5Y18DRAFT_331100 [Xylariaceae sp. FL1019]|nr:hypothetical protein F5Y18DRAFT_331100 [Xylariaceae sp. FL1019]